MPTFFVCFSTDVSVRSPAFSSVTSSPHSGFSLGGFGLETTPAGLEAFLEVDGMRLEFVFFFGAPEDLVVVEWAARG